MQAMCQVVCLRTCKVPIHAFESLQASVPTQFFCLSIFLMLRSSVSHNFHNFIFRKVPPSVAVSCWLAH